MLTTLTLTLVFVAQQAQPRVSQSDLHKRAYERRELRMEPVLRPDGFFEYRPLIDAPYLNVAQNPDAGFPKNPFARDPEEIAPGKYSDVNPATGKLMAVPAGNSSDEEINLQNMTILHDLEKGYLNGLSGNGSFGPSKHEREKSVARAASGDQFKRPGPGYRAPADPVRVDLRPREATPKPTGQPGQAELLFETVRLREQMSQLKSREQYEQGFLMLAIAAGIGLFLKNKSLQKRIRHLEDTGM